LNAQWVTMCMNI